jgi:hypothetical protein
MLASIQARKAPELNPGSMVGRQESFEKRQRTAAVQDAGAISGAALFREASWSAGVSRSVREPVEWT